MLRQSHMNAIMAKLYNNTEQHTKMNAKPNTTHCFLAHSQTLRMFHEVIVFPSFLLKATQFLFSFICFFFVYFHIQSFFLLISKVKIMHRTEITHSMNKTAIRPQVKYFKSIFIEVCHFQYKKSFNFQLKCIFQ